MAFRHFIQLHPIVFTTSPEIPPFHRKTDPKYFNFSILSITRSPSLTYYDRSLFFVFKPNLEKLRFSSTSFHSNSLQRLAQRSKLLSAVFVLSSTKNASSENVIHQNASFCIPFVSSSVTSENKCTLSADPR